MNIRKLRGSRVTAVTRDRIQDNVLDVGRKPVKFVNSFPNAVTLCQSVYSSW